MRLELVIDKRFMIFMMTWGIFFIIFGHFGGISHPETWYKNQAPWLSSGDRYIDEAFLNGTVFRIDEASINGTVFQAQIPAFDREYAIRVEVRDKFQEEEESSYINASIQVFFNNKTEVIHNGTHQGKSGELWKTTVPPNPPYYPAAIRFIYIFTNPTDSLDLRIVVLDASASVQPIWRVEIVKAKPPEVLYIEGFIGGGLAGGILIGFTLTFILYSILKGIYYRIKPTMKPEPIMKPQSTCSMCHRPFYSIYKGYPYCSAHFEEQLANAKREQKEE